MNEFELDEEVGEYLLIPKECGHGFLALEQENIVLYEIEGKYNLETDRGIPWNSIGDEWGRNRLETLNFYKGTSRI